MDFTEYITTWSRTEVFQGKIMISLGILFTVAFIAIIKSDNLFFKGTLIPMSLLLVVLIGYGGYIVYSRPNHVKTSITLFQDSKTEALKVEKAKHINDNKAGNILLSYIYPSLLCIALVILISVSNAYYKGLAIGIAVLAISAYIIDYGFVSRSNAFINYLDTLS